MTTFSELTGRGRQTEGLRWLSVLPADVAVQFVVDDVAQIARYGARPVLNESTLANSVKLVLYHVVPKSAFGIA